MEEKQDSTYVAEVYSKQLAKKMRASMPAPAPAHEQAMLQAASPSGHPMPSPPPPRPRPTRRPVTDNFLSWFALPNEYIMPLGVRGAKPLLGGSVAKWRARGVLRFPSSIQRIEFRTDNISAENQGVLVEGWACWRVSDPMVAVQKLDFSDLDDPMAKTSKVLGIECAGIMKGLISVKTVNDLLKRREDLIDQLREKIKPTEARWGVSFDEIGISEVQILSQSVFENLQRPFRNEAREVAATSDLETEERIADKTAEQRKRVATIEAESDRSLADTRARSQTRIREVELDEEQKRFVSEQKAERQRLEEQKQVQSLKKKIERELDDQRRDHETHAVLGRIAAKQERRLKELEAEEAERIAGSEIRAANAETELEAERVLRATEKGKHLLVLEARGEIARVQAELEAAAQSAEAERLKAEESALVDRKRLRAAAFAERHGERLNLRERERAIEGTISEAEIRARLISTLPEIAGQVKVGDVRWYGGSTAGDGPHGILAGAMRQVLAIAEEHEIDVKALLRGRSDDDGKVKTRKASAKK